MTMKLQFAHQDYQTRAVEAVVKVFDGQPLAKSDRAIAPKLIAVRFPGLSPCSRYPSQRGGAWFGYWPSGGWSRA